MFRERRFWRKYRFWLNTSGLFAAMCLGAVLGILIADADLHKGYFIIPVLISVLCLIVGLVVKAKNEQADKVLIDNG
ncbi:Uncharacterised protein [Trueperella bialowiezensis]|uniref:Uncharacterized protein n=2 Tax=Trueperella bialowiezensis TaxID=312285 RepID=A0A448PDQ3_9ACTO|nr:Uncharacterised protein [Trueperella bialowiezensis]